MVLFFRALLFGSTVLSTAAIECPIITLLPFTARSEYPELHDRPAHIPFSHMATGLMAMEHFNERNPVVVAELADEEFQNCDVYFSLPGEVDSKKNSSTVPSIFADDGDNHDDATRSILDYLYTLHDHQKQVNPQQQDLCAVVGTLTSPPAQAAAALAAASDVPFVTHSAETARIGRFPIHIMSARVTVDEYARGEALVDYLVNHRKRDFVYIIYNFATEKVVRVMEKGAKTQNMTLRSIPVSPPWSDDNKKPNSIYAAVKAIKESGFRTIVVAVSHLFVWEGYDHSLFAEARRQNLTADNGFVWMSYDTTDIEGLASVPTVSGSDRDKVLRGLGTVRVLDGFQYKENDDKFLASIKGQNSGFVQRVNDMNPVQEGEPGYFFAEEDYFRDPSYPLGSMVSFLYDTMIAVGMGACRAFNSRSPTSTTREGRCPAGGKNLLEPTQSSLFNEMTKLEFAGASGQVIIDDCFSYTRDPSTVAFGSFNFRPSKDVDTNTGERRYDYVLTSVKLPGEDAWTKVEDFIFADGTSVEPQPLREIFENNYLSSGARIAGFILFGISTAIGVGGLIWIAVKRKYQVVKAAQPEFLAMVCIGSIMTSFAIVTLSFDENRGWNEEQLSGACMATPFLFVLGYIIAYSALFSKLLRIDKLLQARRRTVKSWQSVGPSLLLLVATLVTLIVWAAKDPLVWVRRKIDEESGDTAGSCTSEHALRYVVPVVTLMVSATVLAGWMAFKTRDVSEAFAETKWIFYAIFAQIQVWVVSLPVVTLVRKDGSTDVAYLGSVLVVWTFAVTIVLLIIGPRVSQELSNSNSLRSMMTSSAQCHVSGMNWGRTGSSNASTPNSKAQESTVRSYDSPQKATRAVIQSEPESSSSIPAIPSLPAGNEVDKV